MNTETFFSTTPTNTLLLIFIIVLGLIMFAATVGWKVYEKTGRQGWKAIIPYYNEWVFFEMSGKPGWWMLMGLITVANRMSLTHDNTLEYYSFMILINLPYYVLTFIASLELGKRFGKSRKFSIINLGLLPFIGWTILAFGKAKYKLPKAK